MTFNVSTFVSKIDEVRLNFPFFYVDFNEGIPWYKYSHYDAQDLSNFC